MYSIRNVEDGQTIALTGGFGTRETNDGSGSQEFCVGLTLDESIVCSIRREDQTSSSVCRESGIHEEQHIVVPLVMVTVWKNSGVTVCPASRDLRCCLNGEDIDKESNIIPGSQIEVADKTLELVEGPTPQRPRPHRRHLPPTPGIPILPSPPPKPQRSKNGGVKIPSPLPPYESLPKKDSLHEELNDWCHSQLPNSEHELLQQAKDPDELASLASSYVTRHINVHTDIAMTTDMADKIAKMLQEVAYHRKEILRKFLSDVISDTLNQNPNMQMTVTSSLNSLTEGVQHSSVTSLLVEILRQFLDPHYLVLLCLQLLRALSHIPGNVVTMVHGQTISAVLGSMAVFRDDEDIQNYCLDILAKMATFVPEVLTKPPMRESSIELVVLAMSLHDTSVTVVAATIRVLANLATSLHSLAFNVMIGSPTPDLRVYVLGVLDVLDYLYQNTCHRIRSALADCGQDLNIKMDGRRFLFEYAKMDQLRCQHQLWEVQPDSPRWLIKDNCPQNRDAESSEMYGYSNYIEDIDRNVSNNKDSNGILKKSRSFENLRTPDRKVFFREETGEKNFNSSSSSSSSALNDESTNENCNRLESPDIQVLSRSRICPTTLSPILPQNNNDFAVQLQQEPFHSSLTNCNEIITPPTPSAQPIRKNKIQAPLVHINSQSDSEAETSDSSMSKFNKDITDFKPMKEVFENPDDRYADICDFDPYGDSSSGLISDYSVTSTCTPPFQHPLPSPSSTQNKQLASHTPVDLEGFSYTSADVVYMKRVMSVQITCHVCSASIKGSNPVALKLIDLPLSTLLKRTGIPKAIEQFSSSQFDPKASLMDIDPAVVIAIIDAVRYKMLAFELVKKSVHALFQRLSPISVHQKIILVLGDLLRSVANDTSLSPVTEDSAFIRQLQTELERHKEKGLDPSIASSLSESIEAVIV